MGSSTQLRWSEFSKISFLLTLKLSISGIRQMICSGGWIWRWDIFKLQWPTTKVQETCVMMHATCSLPIHTAEVTFQRSFCFSSENSLLRWLSWTMRHIQNILVAFPSARDLYCDFFQQISLNFCSRNIYNALQNILQQEQKVHVVCTVVCSRSCNNAQLDNLFNIKRTKIYSISMCYYPSPGVVVDHVLKL